jgi:hypothetical protein
MKIGIITCCVTEETAQSIIIIVTVIIFITTNVITTTIQALSCCKWQIFPSHRSSIHVTEEVCWVKSTNPDILTDRRAAMSDMVNLTKTERRK